MINVGAAANDGTGDDLREAFVKINQNFEDLDLRIDDKTEGANVGGGAGIFKQRQGYNLEFKSIEAGTNVTVTEFENKISLSATGGLQNLIFVTDNGSVHVADGEVVRIQGNTGISTSYDGLGIKIDNTKLSVLAEDTSPQLAGELDANGQNITNAGQITASLVAAAFQGNLTGPVVGNVTGNVHDIDIRTHDPFFTTVDFGSLSLELNTMYDLVKVSLPVDFGTLADPSSTVLDLGSFI